MTSAGHKLLKLEAVNFQITLPNLQELLLRKKQDTLKHVEYLVSCHLQNETFLDLLGEVNIALT